MGIALVVAALVVGADTSKNEKKTVHDAPNLTTQTWIAGDQRTVGQQRMRVLRLRRGSKWSRGTAWIIDCHTPQSDDYAHMAWQGTYVLYGGKLDEDMLEMHVGLTRCYRGYVSGSSVRWQLDTRRSQDDRPGVLFEVALDNRHVPRDVLTLVPTRFYYVDEHGTEITKYTTKKLLGTLPYAQRERDLGRVSFLSGGEILTCEATDALPKAIVDAPPPGFDLLRGAGTRTFTTESARWMGGIRTYEGMVATDWSVQGIGPARLVSLRAGEKATSGSAWVLGWSADGYHAWKGRYTLGPHARRSGVLTLRLWFSRVYLGVPEGSRSIRWMIARESRDIGRGMSLELMPESYLLKNHALTVVVSRCGPADSQGRVTEEGVGSVGFCKLGAVGVLTERGTVDRLLVESAPPGYRPRVTSHLSDRGLARDEVLAATRGESSVGLATSALVVDGERRISNEHYEDAITVLTRALEQSPQSGPAYKHRATAFEALGRQREAKHDYALAVRYLPEDAAVHAQFAWLLATSMDPDVRDGKLALAHAKRACSLTRYQDMPSMSAYAAAHACTGDFANAVYWQRQVYDRCSREQRSEAARYEMR